MELFFDRGTLVIALDARESGASIGALPPYFLWDSRVGRWRAPAHRLPEFRLWLAARGRDAKYSSPRPAGFLPRPVGRERWPELRGYQEEALRAWNAAGCRGLVSLPTGSGKTRLAVSAMLALGLPAAILVPTRQLLEQWKRAIEEFHPGPVGIYGDGEHELEPITVTTYASAHGHFDRIGGHFDLIILDEAHHLASSEVREALQMSTASHRLGLSATFPDSGARLWEHDALLGPVCFSLPLASLAGKYLASFDLKLIPLRLSRDERREYDCCRALFLQCVRPFFEGRPERTWADFVRAASRSPAGREALLALRRSRRIVCLSRAKLLAIEQLLDFHHAEPKLVFTGDNQAAYEVSRRFLVPAITCEIGRLERERILERFRIGGYRTIVSAKVLNEGLDVPAASVGIISGGSSSPLEHVQRIGRVLRPQPGKKALIYELVIEGTSDSRLSERRSRSGALGSVPAL
jgi:superfamily II DNA or RNA helicase